MPGVMTLAEYNRRFDLIVEAFRTGHFTAAEATVAMRELAAQRVQQGVN